EAPSSPEAGHFAGLPYGRQRRQQPDLSLIALQQHFSNRRRSAEVTIDLEGRVCIEHVRIGPLGTQQESEDFIRMVALSQTRPKVNTPCRRPTGGLIATDLQRPFDGRRKIGSSMDIDVMSRE